MHQVYIIFYYLSMQYSSQENCADRILVFTERTLDLILNTYFFLHFLLYMPLLASVTNALKLFLVDNMPGS